MGWRVYVCLVHTHTCMTISRKPITCKNLRENFTKFVRDTNKWISPSCLIRIFLPWKIFTVHQRSRTTIALSFSKAKYFYWQLYAFRLSWLRALSAWMTKRNSRRLQLVGKKSFFLNGNIYLLSCRNGVFRCSTTVFLFDDLQYWGIEEVFFLLLFVE